MSSRDERVLVENLARARQVINDYAISSARADIPDQDLYTHQRERLAALLEKHLSVREMTAEVEKILDPDHELVGLLKTFW
ncbi:hypothetical protein [Gordonia sputi]|uniref:hypothetical protein n=1 Tax=Gordonia sputi TaxID=36823 RepID=UPI00369E0757